MVSKSLQKGLFFQLLREIVDLGVSLVFCSKTEFVTLKSSVELPWGKKESRNDACKKYQT